VLLIRLASVIFSRYSTPCFNACFFILTPNHSILCVWVLPFGCVMLHFFAQCSTVSSASAYLALQNNVSLVKITAENSQTSRNGCHGNQDKIQHSLTHSITSSVSHEISGKVQVFRFWGRLGLIKFCSFGFLSRKDLSRFRMNEQPPFSGLQYLKANARNRLSYPEDGSIELLRNIG
jgi:hypothetical protein